MQTLETLTAIFRDVFDDPSLVITGGTTADDIEDWDSVAQVNLVLTIENSFDVRLTMDEATDINSVAGFIEAIDRHR